MVVTQIKQHGTVLDFSFRSKAAAREEGRKNVEGAQAKGYTLVGSAPGLTILVCPQHASGLPVDADFCFIVSVP